jgi:hypothetical protein
MIAEIINWVRDAYDVEPLSADERKAFTNLATEASTHSLSLFCLHMSNPGNKKYYDKNEKYRKHVMRFASNEDKTSLREQGVKLGGGFCSIM